MSAYQRVSGRPWRIAALVGIVALLVWLAVAAVDDGETGGRSASPGDSHFSAGGVVARPVALGTPTPHLVVVMLENKEFSAVVGNSAAPYLNDTLIPGGKLFTAHYASTHPSLPNYLVLTSGHYAGCVTDLCPVRSISGPNLFSHMNQAAVPAAWKVYAEGMPVNCHPTSSAAVNGYLVRHNPPVYYSNLGPDGDNSCSQRDVPLTQLTKDLQQGTLPDFAMVIPNQWNDMHSDRNKAPCSLGSATQNMVCQGDTWLATWVPQLLSNGGRNDTTVLVTFDEGTTSQGGAGRVVLLEAGPSVCAGCTEPTPSNHYGLSNAIEQWFGLPPLYPTAPSIAPQQPAVTAVGG